MNQEVVVTTIWQIMEDAIRELNRGLPSDSRVEWDPERVLFGDSGDLSSLDTVNYLVLLEDGIRNQYPSCASLIERLMEDGDGGFPATPRELHAIVLSLCDT